MASKKGRPPKEALAQNCEGDGTLLCTCRMCSAVRETLNRILKQTEK